MSSLVREQRRQFGRRLSAMSARHFELNTSFTGRVFVQQQVGGGVFNYFPLTGLRLIRTCGERAGEEWRRLSTPPPIGPVDLCSAEVPPAPPRLHLIESRGERPAVRFRSRMPLSRCSPTVSVWGWRGEHAVLARRSVVLTLCHLRTADRRHDGKESCVQRHKHGLARVLWRGTRSAVASCLFPGQKNR